MVQNDSLISGFWKLKKQGKANSDVGLLYLHGSVLAQHLWCLCTASKDEKRSEIIVSVTIFFRNVSVWRWREALRENTEELTCYITKLEDWFNFSISLLNCVISRFSHTQRRPEVRPSLTAKKANKKQQTTSLV